MKFSELVLSIALEVVQNEGFLETFEALKIQTSDWPVGPVRSMVETYLDTRRKVNHDFAQHSASEAYASLRGYLNFEPPPMVEGLLEPLYFELHGIDRIERLAKSLLENPKRGDEFISDYQKNAKEITQVLSLGEAIDIAIPELNEKRRAGKTCVKLPDFPLLSEAIGGFNPGRVMILLADTGFGKTNLGIQLGLSAAQIVPVLYFNMEMIRQDFSERVIVSMSDITYKDLYRDGVNEHLVRSQAARRNFCSTNGQDLSTDEVRSIIRTEQRKRGIKFVVVDYDQKLILHTDHQTPEWKALQLAVIAIESLSKELDLTTIVLAQQNSEGTISGSRRSTFSASTVLSFHNEPDIGDVIVATKNRFGSRNAAVKVDYLADRAQVKELERTIISKKKKAIK